MLTLDHLAVAAATLEEGAAAVEAALGVTLSPGGQHPHMGTHNRLLSLGPGEYLEVIAVDPGAVPPGRSRWFDLDRFDGPPRLSTWICRCTGLEDQARVPPGAGPVHALSRGDLSWRMAIPDDGRQAFDGLFPALIEWEGRAHPSGRLPDAGCRLLALRLTHPDAGALRAALAGRLDDPRVTVAEGSPGMRAEIATPSGLRVLE